MTRKKAIIITDARPKRRPFWGGALVTWLATASALPIEVADKNFPAWGMVICVAFGFMLGCAFLWPGMKR